MQCETEGCENSAAVRVHIPWADTRTVCPAHARVFAQQDGVVAKPIEGTDGQWP